MQLAEIRIRDPFIVPDKAEQIYYLFGTTDENTWAGKATGFDCYTSRDLQNWHGPFAAFRPEPGFWADENFWAPEVFFCRGHWYLIASFKAAGRHRGVQLFCSESPAGPYRPLTEMPVTPPDWDCLDGTLFWEGQVPWLIFSHEWQQIRDGAICAMPLSADLRRAAGAPVVLFHASQAPWVVPGTGPVNGAGTCYVTDGPFAFRDGKNHLHLLWSSFAPGGYAIGVAHSQTDCIAGPWTHAQQPLPVQDGGHGMLFETFAGETLLVIHAPNVPGRERAKLLKMSRLLSAEERK